MKRSVSLIVAALAVCLGAAVGVGAHSTITPAQCASRVNDTPAKLVECIQKGDLSDHMDDLQGIANANPGPDGMPSRNSGEPGYKASVDYVAGLMQAAGYKVTLQKYPFDYYAYTGIPTMNVDGNDLTLGVDWGPGQSLGKLDGTQTLTTVNNNVLPPTETSSSAAGCDPSNFGPEVSGHPVLIQRGTCTFSQKVANAQAAGATGVIIFNEGNTTPDRTGLLVGSLATVPTIPVAFTTFAIGNQMAQEIKDGNPPSPSVDIKAVYRPNADDWNVIADSKFGDPNHTLVVDAHLDSIYGAGMLDNATGSVAILAIALMLQHTPTQNHLRFIWFGGEELGLFGSAYYINHLSNTDYNHIGFDLDADVFGTPNHLIGVLDPAAPDLFSKVVPETFPKSVYKPSTAAEQLSINYFTQAGLNHELISPNGTDAINFNRVGIPASGMLTGQDCCKTQAEVDLFGGQTGNFDGNLGTTDGGCVDQPFRWCDNWPANVDADNFTLMSQAFADTVERMAFDTKIMSSSNNTVYKKKIPPGHIRNEPTG
jgi:hypothetical protein